MRRLVSLFSFAFALALPLVACDSTTTDGPDTAVSGEQMADELTVEPGLISECHAAFHDASASLEAARLDAAACTSDSDCTVAVADTRCTGEVDQAVSVTGEAGFLGFVDRLDTRLCADVAPSCAAAPADEPAEREVACVAQRCTLVEE